MSTQSDIPEEKEILERTLNQLNESSFTEIKTLFREIGYCTKELSFYASRICLASTRNQDLKDVFSSMRKEDDYINVMKRNKEVKKHTSSKFLYNFF
jgi:hypothetical protein